MSWLSSIFSKSISFVDLGPLLKVHIFESTKKSLYMFGSFSSIFAISKKSKSLAFFLMHTGGCTS
jgi:hypothetical protein